MKAPLMTTDSHRQKLFPRMLKRSKHLLGILGLVIIVILVAGKGNATRRTVEHLPSASSGIRFEGEKTIVLARATWDTGWFQTEVFRILLQELGYTVPEPKTWNNQDFYRLTAQGEIDLWANGWFPLHNPFIQENHPDVNRLLQLVEIPLRDISAQNARMLDGEDDDGDIRRHAQDWITTNREKIDGWLMAARSLQPAKQIALPQREEALHPRPEVLRVVTKRFEPFVIYQDRGYIGFSIDLWEQIAADLGLKYKLYGVNTIAKLLDEVERGVADVAISGISITVKREQALDFSHAYFETGVYQKIFDKWFGA
jgi:hypothetical protein